MILLTGATGFVGRAVLTQLIQQPELTVRTYGRRAPIGLPINLDHVVGELGAGEDYAPALQSVDVVIHCAAQAHMMVSIHRNSIDTGKMRRSSLDPTFLLA